MRRFLAERAEIARRADERLAKVVLPDAIDDDAGRERIVLRGDGVREFEPAAALRELGGLVAGKNLEETARGFFAEFGGVAAQEDLHVRGARLGHAVCDRQRL